LSLIFNIGMTLREAREQRGAALPDRAWRLKITKFVIERVENHAEGIKYFFIYKICQNVINKSFVKLIFLIGDLEDYHISRDKT